MFCGCHVKLVATNKFDNFKLHNRTAQFNYASINCHVYCMYQQSQIPSLFPVTVGRLRDNSTLHEMGTDLI